MKIAVLLLTAAAVPLLVVPNQASQAADPPAPMQIGSNWHADWAAQKTPAVRDRVLSSMASWGAKSVRIDVSWASLEPRKGAYNWTGLDTYIGEAERKGMTSLVMLYWPPQWSSGTTSKAGMPRDARDYGQILGQLGKRYGDRLAGVEMWNEPDLPVFWPGNQRQFLDMLAVAYPIAKNLAPSTTFIAGAPTYLGLASKWYPNAYADPRFRPGTSFDAVAIHPYMSPSDLPPSAPASNWSIKGIPKLNELRAANGDTTRLWATEFGWSTHNNSTYPTPVPNFKRGVTPQQQAQYTVDAFQALKDLNLAAAYVYTGVDMPQSDAQENYFGFLKSDLTPKPVVDAMRRWTGSIPPPVDQLAALQAANAALRTQNATLTAENSRLKTRIDSLQAENAALTNRIARLQAQKVSARQGIARAISRLNKTDQILAQK